jgi:Transposase DDE domain group 1
LLLRATDGAIRLIERFAACFVDWRKGELIEHLPATLVGQRVFGIALGYEDVNDHDELRHDPIMAVLAGKLRARRKNCAPVAGKSTLNRLELSRETATRYHKIGHDSAAVERLFVALFLEAHETPEEIIIDLDATDDPLFCRSCACSAVRMTWIPRTIRLCPQHRRMFPHLITCHAHYQTGRRGFSAVLCKANPTKSLHVNLTSPKRPSKPTSRRSFGRFASAIALRRLFGRTIICWT